MDIIDKAKEFYRKQMDGYWLSDFHKGHVFEFEQIANSFPRRFPETDMEIMILSIWLHDLGLPSEGEGDHAVIGEAIAREWLASEGYDAEKMDKVCHCIRAHRCRDVMPETLEAKLIAFGDSASHLTQGVHFDIAKENKRGNKYDALEKLERDWRDLSLFPEMKEDFRKLYEAWKAVIIAYREINV